MHNLKKILSVLLALVMVLGLMACGKEEAPTPTEPAVDGQEITETPSEAIGSVNLIGTTRLTLHYNAEGNVVTITDQEGVLCHSSLIDTPCAEAVVQIIKETEGPFAESFLLIKQEASTLVPNETFLQDIVTKVQAEVANLPVILSSAMDQDDQGYFSAETAKAVLAAYLGNPEGAEYASTGKPVDGYYQVGATVDGVQQNYTVGALYGAVELELEIGDEAADNVEEPIVPEAEQPVPNDPDPSQDNAEETISVPDDEIDEFVEEPTEEIVG